MNRPGRRNNPAAVGAQVAAATGENAFHFLRDLRRRLSCFGTGGSNGGSGGGSGGGGGDGGASGPGSSSSSSNGGAAGVLFAASVNGSTGDALPLPQTPSGRLIQGDGSSKNNLSKPLISNLETI